MDINEINDKAVKSASVYVSAAEEVVAKVDISSDDIQYFYPTESISELEEPYISSLKSTIEEEIEELIENSTMDIISINVDVTFDLPHNEVGIQITTENKSQEDMDVSDYE